MQVGRSAPATARVIVFVSSRPLAQTRPPKSTDTSTVGCLLAGVLACHRFAPTGRQAAQSATRVTRPQHPTCKHHTVRTCATALQPQSAAQAGRGAARACSSPSRAHSTDMFPTAPRATTSPRSPAAPAGLRPPLERHGVVLVFILTQRERARACVDVHQGTSQSLALRRNNACWRAESPTRFRSRAGIRGKHISTSSCGLEHGLSMGGSRHTQRRSNSILCSPHAVKPVRVARRHSSTGHRTGQPLSGSPYHPSSPHTASVMLPQLILLSASTAPSRSLPRCLLLGARYAFCFGLVTSTYFVVCYSVPATASLPTLSAPPGSCGTYFRWCRPRCGPAPAPAPASADGAAE